MHPNTTKVWMGGKVRKVVNLGVSALTTRVTRVGWGDCSRSDRIINNYDT